MAHDVFISYSRKDMAVADRICEAFDKVGISYFIDRQGIGGGFEFPEVLANAIVECKVVLYLASENSYASKFTNAEMTFAFNEKSKNSILPYIIDGSTMPPALRFVFAGVNWRNIKDHPVETVLVADILKLLGREPKPEVEHNPEPPRPPRKPLNKNVLMALLCGVAAVVVLCVAIMGISADNKESSRHTKKSVTEVQSQPMAEKKVDSIRKTEMQSEIKRFDKTSKSVDAKPETKIVEAESTVEKKVESQPMAKKKVEPSKKELEKVAKTYKVGDYYDDGKKRGVVFEVTADGKHGKIVSLTESSNITEWSSDVNEQERLIGTYDRYNGANNMAKVRQVEGWRKKYPAFAWCADLGEGWYLPAIEELKKFTLNSAIHNAVNRRLATLGTKLANEGGWYWYWSSTEDNHRIGSGEFCAWAVVMCDGNTNYFCKSETISVRAVSAF